MRIDFLKLLVLVEAFIELTTAFFVGAPFIAHTNLFRKPFVVSTLPRSQSQTQDATFEDKQVSPLIPIETLFGNLEYRDPSLSPDGKYLAYIGPKHSDGSCCYIFVRRLDEPLSSAKIVVPDNRIRSYFWAYDSRTILYYVNSGEPGSEMYHLWAVDAIDIMDGLPLENVRVRDLIPWKNAKVQNAMVNKHFPDQVLIVTNARDSSLFHVYRCNITTGHIEVDTINPGDVVSWGCHDQTFQVRHALALDQSDSSTVLRVRDSMSDPWRDLYVYPYGDKGRFVAFCNHGKNGWITSNTGRDTVALLKINLATGAVCSDTEAFGSEKADIEEIVIDNDSKVAMLSYYYDKKTIQFFDSALKSDYDVLVAKGPVENLHEVNVISKVRNETLWLVSYEPSDAPNFYAIYHKHEKIVKPLFCSHPALLEYRFATMEIFTIYARDNVPLVCYLTRPNVNTKECYNKPSPLVQLVHGGPWERDRYGFNPLVQFFANRGYAVLQVNYRGSSGFGKKFMNLGDGQWGVGGMQHDLTDAVKWCIDKGIAKADAICIYGASYGGYACLAGLAFTPNLYRCGVSIAGVSNCYFISDSS
jgi:dipeptidyl aminopeptidase/acylaminoacyl peptidase